MITTNLMAVQDSGGKLVMMDGTIWIVNPQENNISASWEPPSVIHIKEGNSTNEHDYLIINMELELSVSAKRRR